MRPLVTAERYEDPTGSTYRYVLAELTVAIGLLCVSRGLCVVWMTARPQTAHTIRDATDRSIDRLTDRQAERAGWRGREVDRATVPIID